MTRVEVLERSVAFPLELNPAICRHEGVPVEVLNQCPQIRPWFLVAWNDEASGTIGLLQKKHVVVLQRDDVIGLALNFMKPAKGRGWVALDVNLQSQRSWRTLLQSPFFRQDAVDWVIEKMDAIESYFSMKITIFDRGSDY